MLEIKNVSKIYKKKYALKDVSLSFERGKVYGLLGRNGAGKTTLINIINDRIAATSGAVYLDGKPIKNNGAQLSQIFTMIENDTYPNMKLKEILYWTARFYPHFDKQYADELLIKFGVNNLKKQYQKLSTGYKVIFKLVLTMASNAPIIIFDEPVLGLDAHHRELFYKELILHYTKTEQTVIVSTHLIDEVSNLIEDVIFINNGQVLLTEPVEKIKAQAYTVTGSETNVDRYCDGKNVINSENIGKIKSSTILDTQKDSDLINELQLDASPARLQDIFIQLTNQGGA